MRTTIGRRTHRTHRWAGALVALLCALPLVGLSAAPALAARPGRAGISWVNAQILNRGPSVAVEVQWPRVRGATSYQIELALSSGAISSTEVQGSSTKRTVTVRGTSSSVQRGVATGLRPGSTYCFQIRARNRSGFGHRGGLHCKVTVRANRPVPPSPIPMAIATYNTCSSACTSTLGAWSARGPRVRDRVLQMNIGANGRRADIVAIQEGNLATPYLTSALDGTFTRGCQTGDGTGHPSHDLQSLFVRYATYEVVPGTAGGLLFAQYDDPVHGACWVKVRDKASQQEVVVVSAHLWNGDDTAGDTRRGLETDLLADTVKATFPDSPIVYAGDFNSTRSRARDTPLNRMHSDGQDDAYDQAARYLSRPYRNSACGTSTTPRTSWRWGNHIDRVFAPARTHVATWEVDYRMDGSRYLAPLPSDHHPVLVSLLITRQ
ncbi:endonuclease/exonuclease/phosphatase family protein [Nocardioides sp. CPCC 206347]|uniref:endonuclease/exonuclease/phosphatase family protein n=1 Tax=Nocardioides sp. CPCC 206347 TaxID=3406463 RepID=UPI003B43A30A